MSVSQTHPFLRRPVRIFASAIATALAVPGAGESADDESVDDAGALEVIVVTAEKREEDILKVPLTVSAFNDRLIEELGMTNDKDIEQLVPGLQFGNDNVRWGQGTVIRGIGSRNWGEVHSDLAVATYVDGVYTRSGFAIAPNLFDVERLEVGRGPQGTLNGRNSVAGSISYVNKKPTDEWEAELLTEFTDQFTQRYNVAFGGPLGDQLSFRVTGGYHDGDGGQENIGFGDDYDAPHQTSFAPQLRLRTDRLDVNLRYARTEDTGSPETTVLLYDPRRDLPYNCWQEDTDSFSFLPADQTEAMGDTTVIIDGEEVELISCDGGTPESPTNKWYLYGEPSPAVEDCEGVIAIRCDELENRVNFNRSGVSDTSRESWTLNADFNLSETLTVRYTYGRSDVQHFGSEDLDKTNRVPSAADPTLSADAGVGFRDESLSWPYYEDNMSHELQLFSHFDGPLNFIAGLYYYENSADNRDLAQYFSHPLRFTNSDETARQVDIDDDGEGDFADCADFLENYVLPLFEEEEEEEDEGGFAFGVGCPEGQLLAELGNSPTDHLNRGVTISRSETVTRALFLSGDYRFNEQWAVSGGLRWTEDEKSQDRNGDVGWFTMRVDGPRWGLAPGGVVMYFFEDAPADGIHAWDALIWNVSVEYTPVDTAMVYGRISTGYRAGSFTLCDFCGANTIFGQTVDEETLINYEVGVKGWFFDQRLNIRSAAFRNDYDGYQINALTVNPRFDLSPFAESPIIEFIDNIDDTTIWGAEAEATFYINENWRVSGFYSYLDSSLGPFQSIISGDPDPDVRLWEHLDWDSGEMIVTPYAAPKEITGGKLSMQAKHKAAVTAVFEKALDPGLGAVQLLGTWSYTGERFPQIQNIEEQRLPGYGRLDLRATWMSANGQWSATVYLQNAFDKIGVQEVLVGRAPNGTLTEPRQAGVQVRWRPQF